MRIILGRTNFRTSELAAFAEAIRQTDSLIDGFQSPLGMETLATVGWLLECENAEATVVGIRSALNRWPTPGAAERKQRLFTDKLIQAALDRLATVAE